MRKNRCLTAYIIIIISILCFVFSGCKKEEMNVSNLSISENISDEKNDVNVSKPVEMPEEEATEIATDDIVIDAVDKQEEIQSSNLLSPLNLDGTRLVDSEGNPVQLRGISTHGLSWFPQYVNQEFFSELSDEWNANVVRLAMYTAENGGYCSGGDKESLKQLVKNGVEYATNAGLYVIIDWHILQDNNPQTNQEEAKVFFEEMSKEYASYENVLYEICNEPNGGTTWSQVKSYAEEIIPVIRANDEDAIIIVGTPTWSQEVDKAVADPIKGYENIMYTLHFYAATHTDWLRERMETALSAGLPIFVTEFGTCDASGNGGIDFAQSNEWIKTMDENGVSYVAWNLSNKNETSAIFKADCRKTSGFTADDLTENGKWIYDMLKNN